MEIEIYWYHLPEEKQQELINAGYDNANVTSGSFPVTTVFVDKEEKEVL